MLHKELELPNWFSTANTNLILDMAYERQHLTFVDSKDAKTIVLRMLPLSKNLVKHGKIRSIYTMTGIRAKHSPSLQLLI
jgi:hypothetical protein